jgi:hypothetical protein
MVMDDWDRIEGGKDSTRFGLGVLGTRLLDGGWVGGLGIHSGSHPSWVTVLWNSPLSLGWGVAFGIRISYGFWGRTGA